MSIQLSVVIITYNEEKNIARCLDSLKGIADDIIVVDSFSKDKTKGICLSYGARVVEHVFEGHIQQKNYAITQALYPYILSLDADEALDEELKTSILNIKNNWIHHGYSMNRLTNYCGKWIYHCGWYPDVKLRLFDSRKGKWGGVNPHDKYSLNDASDKVQHIKGDILHYSYYTIKEHYKQAEYFSNIASKAMFANGKKASFVKLYLSPTAKFIKSYFIKMGFLDGYYGWKISYISAWETFRKYYLLKQLYQKK